MINWAGVLNVLGSALGVAGTTFVGSYEAGGQNFDAKQAGITAGIAAAMYIFGHLRQAPTLTNSPNVTLK